MSLEQQLEALIPAYLERQRWFSGSDSSAARLDTCEVLLDGEPGLVWAIATVDGARYQLVVGMRRADSLPASVVEAAQIGEVDLGEQALIAYDALFDRELGSAVLDIVMGGPEPAAHMRPMGAEQSNTSVVFDERIVLKLFRRLHDGRNPDVEVTAALPHAGFPYVAKLLGVWERDGVDLAVCQEFLVGATDGWALALTSVRDMYASPEATAREAGGDFAAEAARLGDTTARLHVAMARAFGMRPADTLGWADSVQRQLDNVDRPDLAAAKELVEELRHLDDAGVAIRVHGDYHLGQVMRGDAGWYVMDFEGEPARPLQERQMPHSPFKDVTGMLRSFHYASVVGGVSQDPARRYEAGERPKQWEERNRSAFLDAYLASPGIEDLLPRDAGARELLLSVLELEKAAYESAYERAFRPDWAFIPDGALDRLLAG